MPRSWRVVISTVTGRTGQGRPGYRRQVCVRPRLHCVPSFFPQLLLSTVEIGKEKGEIGLFR